MRASASPRAFCTIYRALAPRGRLCKALYERRATRQFLSQKSDAALASPAALCLQGRIETKMLKSMQHPVQQSMGSMNGTGPAPWTESSPQTPPLLHNIRSSTHDVHAGTYAACSSHAGPVQDGCRAQAG